jgi:hypothetical protein
MRVLARPVLPTIPRLIADNHRVGLGFQLVKFGQAILQRTEKRLRLLPQSLALGDLDASLSGAPDGAVDQFLCA